VSCPAGFEDLRDEQDVVDGLVALRERRPALRRAVVKLNDSFSGEGNAIVDFPSVEGRPGVVQALDRIRCVAPSETREHFFRQFALGGGIVEEFVEGAESRSPSAQLRTSPTGESLALSTHDQILGGESGQIFLGCRFPADDGYRMAVQEAGLRVGQSLAAQGVVSRFGVDFMATRSGPEAPWSIQAIEINLRLGGTTHPFLALRFLCGGQLDRDTGLYHSESGRAKYYRATDNLYSPRYRGLLPEDLIELVTINQLSFSHRDETGVLFHMIGALSQYGKLGLTGIGNSHAEADTLYERALAVLEAETGYG
jgi:hypothetical protein